MTLTEKGKIKRGLECESRESGVKVGMPIKHLS